ncbi:MAG: ImmA/IrrE family metallo-endopeptidase [Anaerovoracaceae bacterium]|nr:ImmA/IrrE family metallo-endopeptidase [Anaerovoracaceae bacterium]
MNANEKVISPGEVLDRKLKDNHMSRKEMAVRTGVTEKHVNTIITGDRRISTSYARKIGYVFPPAKYWLDLQNRFDQEQLKIQEENEITKEELAVVRRLHDIIPYLIGEEDLAACRGDNEKVMKLREVLCVSDLTVIPKITYNAAYRAQLSNASVDPYVLYAWQRMCELETESIMPDKKLDKNALSSRIADIKAMMFGDINKGIEGLRGLLAECGIAFQVVRNFRGAPVQGFIKEAEGGRMILCLTIRGRRADSFWFTLFHEIAHILYEDYKHRFVDFSTVKNAAEDKADRFAQNTLIDPKLYRKFIQSPESMSWENIEKLASEAGVKPFVVLGRLQNDGLLDWTDYADHVERYSWAV